MNEEKLKTLLLSIISDLQFHINDKERTQQLVELLEDTFFQSITNK